MCDPTLWYLDASKEGNPKRLDQHLDKRGKSPIRRKKSEEGNPKTQKSPKTKPKGHLLEGTNGVSRS